MALSLNQCTTLGQLQTYARDGAVDAMKKCPNAADLYDDALMAALQGKPFALVKAQLVMANSMCGAEAYGPGGVYYGKSKPSGATTYPGASATDLVPPGGSSSPSGGSSSTPSGSSSLVTAGVSGGSGWPWWLLLGGAALVGWLIFGKKGKKGKK